MPPPRGWRRKKWLIRLLRKVAFTAFLIPARRPESRPADGRAPPWREWRSVALHVRALPSRGSCKPSSRLVWSVGPRPSPTLSMGDMTASVSDAPGRAPAGRSR